MGTALQDQDSILKDLLKVGKSTEFGREHGLDKVNSYEEFKKAVPIRDYESFKPYIQKIKEGKHNILWKGMPIYFAKTSGTTSGVKYIPISKESIPNHINTARNALLCYMAETGNTDFADGKMIFLSGSPELREALLKRRNLNWARWIQRRMAAPGSVFVAVGAGHLAGPDSVVSMLQRDGYRVRRIQ